MRQQSRNKKYVAKQKRLVVSNEVKLDAKSPIPFEDGDFLFTSVNNTQYLPFLGKDNRFGKKLLEARLLSNTHFACINTKRDYIAGVGFQDADQKDLDQRIIDWFDNMNLKNEDVTSINANILEYFLTFGNSPIEIVRYTSGTTKELNIYVKNFLECRLAKPDEDGIIRNVVISKLFKDSSYYNADVKETRTIKLYNPRDTENCWTEDEFGAERTIIWYKNPVAGVEHYGLPSAIAGLIYEILEFKGARYDLDNFDNNMVVQALLFLKGNLSQDEADRIGKKIVQNHTGDGKRGRTMVFASEEGIDQSMLHSLDTQKDGSYRESDDKWVQKIILANNWDAVLAGIISPSSLGKGGGYLTKIIEHKLNTVIKPAQRKLVKNVWSHIFQIAEDWLNLPFSKYELEIKSEIDISGLTDVDITPAVKVNEVRKAKGLPEDPDKEGQYMPSGKSSNSKEGGDNVSDQ